MKNLERVFDDKNGSFGYRKAGDSNYNLTGVGVLSRLFWLHKQDKMTREGIKNIETKEIGYDKPDANLYAWYYDTQACFMAQGQAWQWWNRRFQDEIVDHQADDGSWPPTGNRKEPGNMIAPTGDPQVYRTTLCTLMLEVYYRYLPTGREQASELDAPKGL
jgi:hypothetical protein